MRRCIAVLLLACGVIAAAPVPKSGVKKLEEVYGEVTDAKGKCTLEMQPTGAVRVSVPKEEPLFVLEHQKLPPVLTRKTIDGDFELTIRVTHTPPSEAGNAKDSPFNYIATSAGVAVVGEGREKESVVLAHHHVKKGDKWVSGISHFTNHNQGSNAMITGNAKLNTEPVWLRLTRRGEAVVSESSADGKKWVQVVNHPTLGLGTKLTVGLIAYQSTDSDYQAEFDQYEIKPLKEEKK